MTATLKIRDENTAPFKVDVILKWKLRISW